MGVVLYHVLEFYPKAPECVVPGNGGCLKWNFYQILGVLGINTEGCGFGADSEKRNDDDCMNDAVGHAGTPSVE